MLMLDRYGVEAILSCLWNERNEQSDPCDGVTDALDSRIDDADENCEA
jgi:hypothetical protein